MTFSVSIAISTYNGEKYINDTINSCLLQTYNDIKIVVIDDCSSDSTVSLLNEFGNKITLIVNKENKGITKNINLAIKAIDSDFVIFLGHDDILPPKHVEDMLKSFTDDSIVAVHCNSQIIDSDGNHKSFSRNDDLQRKKTDNALFELSQNNFIQSCGMMHRVSAFNQVGGWDERYKFYGEWLYYIKVLSVGRVTYSNLSYAYYRRHDTNISKSLRDKALRKSFINYSRKCRILAFSLGNFKLHQKINYLIYFLYINIIELLPMGFKRFIKRALRF